MLKFLIVILCIFFLLRTFSKMFVVSSFNAINKKMQDEMRRHQGASQNKPEGHISIDPGVRQQQQRNDDGDYADYEEVK